MISFVKGPLVSKTQGAVCVEANGIGYEINMSASGLSKLPSIGEEVLIYTYLQVREDAFVLFGFLSQEEKALFLRLISVSGVGPKVALSALSAYSPQDLIAYITAQDITAISRISGVGKKTASRIVLELKGSIDKDLLGEGSSGASLFSQAMQAASEALLSMGFTSEEVELALKDAPESADESSLLQYALKRLGER